MSIENLEDKVKHLEGIVETLKEIEMKHAGEIGNLQARVRVLEIRHDNEDKYNFEQLKKLTGKLARVEAEVKVLLED